ncbi:MAG: hypothetical protein M1269_07575, partial [Chloroflexi bacterium]|nr:hypothetical protein [Chloroflexota bacterium]
LSQITYANGDIETYNTSEQLIQKYFDSEDDRTEQYDPSHDGRFTRIDYADASYVVYTYDDEENTYTIEYTGGDNDGVVEKYDDQDRIVSRDVPDDGLYTWEYFDDCYIIRHPDTSWEKCYSNGRMEQYDVKNRIASYYMPGEGTSTYDYSPDGYYTLILPNGDIEEHRDSDDSLQKITYVSGIAESYDEQGRITEKDEPGVGITTWTYSDNGGYSKEMPDGSVTVYNSIGLVDRTEATDGSYTIYYYNVEESETHREYYRSDDTVEKITYTSGNYVDDEIINQYYDTDETLTQQDFSDDHIEYYDSEERIIKYINSDGSYNERTYETDGSKEIVYYNSSEEYQKTEYYRTDGTLDKIIYANEMVEYYDSNGVNWIRREYADGSIAEPLPEGGYQQTNGNGDVETYNANDVLIQIDYVNGDQVLYRTDSTVEEKTYADGRARFREYYATDGTTIIKYDISTGGYIVRSVNGSDIIWTTTSEDVSCTDDGTNETWALPDNIEIVDGATLTATQNSTPFDSVTKNGDLITLVMNSYDYDIILDTASYSVTYEADSGLKYTLRADGFATWTMPDDITLYKIIGIGYGQVKDGEGASTYSEAWDGIEFTVFDDSKVLNFQDELTLITSYKSMLNEYIYADGSKKLEYFIGNLNEKFTTEISADEQTITTKDENNNSVSCSFVNGDIEVTDGNRTITIEYDNFDGSYVIDVDNGLEITCTTTTPRKYELPDGTTIQLNSNSYSINSASNNIVLYDQSWYSWVSAKDSNQDTRSCTYSSSDGSYTVTNGDGSTTKVKTDFTVVNSAQNGMQYELYDDDSEKYIQPDGIWTTVSADGQTVYSEDASQNSLTTTRDQDGTLHITRAEGCEVTISTDLDHAEDYDDWVDVTYYRNGTKRFDLPNGTTVYSNYVENEYGVVDYTVYSYSDGSVVWRYYGNKFTMDANRNIIVSAPDGRYCKWSASGDINIVHPDGRHTYTKSDNTLETKDLDGTILTTTVDSEGKVTVENQDGSATTIDLDGNWMINYDNGVFVRNYLEVNNYFTNAFLSKRIYLPSNLYLQINYDGSILSGNTHSFKGETWNHVPSPVRNSDGSYSFTANGIAYHLDTDFNLKATKGTGISRLEWISNADGSVELRDGTDYSLSMDTSENITATDKFGNTLSATLNQDGSFTTTLANGTEVTIYENLEKKVEYLSGLTILYRTNGTRQITVPDPLISGGLVIEINSSGTITSSKENGVDRSWSGQVITLGNSTSIEIIGDVIKHTATDGTYTKRLAENTVESYNSSDQLTGTTYSTSLYNWNKSTVVRGTDGTVTSITEVDNTTATWDSQNSKWVSDDLIDGSIAEYNCLGVLTSHIREYDNGVEVKIEGNGTITYTIPDGVSDTIEIERELDDDLTATRNSQTYSETPSILDDGGIRIENNDGLISTLETDKDLKITDPDVAIYMETFNSNGTWELHNYDGSIVQKDAQGTITSFLTVDNATPTFDDPGYHAALNDGSISYYDSDGRLTYNIDTIVTGYTKKITAEGALRYDLDNEAYYVEVKGGSATTDGTSASVDGSGNITVNITGGKYVINSDSDITFYDDGHYHHILPSSNQDSKKAWTLFSDGTKDLYGSDGSVTHLNSSGSVTSIVTREGTNATEQQDDTWEATLFDGATSYFDTDGVFVENSIVKVPYTYNYSSEGIKWEYDSGMIKEQLTDGTIKWTQPNGTVSTITDESDSFYWTDPDNNNALVNSNLTLETKDSSETTLSSRFPVVFNSNATDTANTRTGEIIINNGDDTFTYIFSTGLRVIYDDNAGYITEILQPNGVKSTYNGSSWSTVDKNNNSLTTTDNQDGTFTVSNPEGGSFTWKEDWVNSSGYAQEYWKLITENGLEIEHNPEKVVNHDGNYHQKWVTNFGQTCEIEANVYNITITQGYSVSSFDSLNQILKYNTSGNDIYYEVALDLSGDRYTIDGVDWTYYADGSEFITQAEVGYTKIAPDDTASSMDMAFDTASTTMDENDNVVITGNYYDVTIAPDGDRDMELDNGLEIEEDSNASGTWTLPDDTVLTVAANRASATAVASDNTSLTCYKLSDGSFKVYNLNGSQTIITPDFKLICESAPGYLTTTIDQDNSKTIETSFGYTIDINAASTSAEVHNTDGDTVSCTLNVDGTVSFELNNEVEMTVSFANTAKLERGDLTQEILVDGTMKFIYQGNEIFLNSAGEFDAEQSRDYMNRTFLNPNVYSNGSMLMFYKDMQPLWLPSLITEGTSDSYSDSARWDVVDSDTTDGITILEHADGIFTRIDQLGDRTEYAANGLRIKYRAYGWTVVYLPNLDQISLDYGSMPYAIDFMRNTLNLNILEGDRYKINYANGDIAVVDAGDMSVTYYNADGIREVLHSDGTFDVYNADGSEMSTPDDIVVENLDGTTATRSDDGTLVFTTPDNSTPTQKDDGTYSNTLNNGDQALYTSDGVLMAYTYADGFTKNYERDETLASLSTESGTYVTFFGDWNPTSFPLDHWSGGDIFSRIVYLPDGESIVLINVAGKEVAYDVWDEDNLLTANLIYSEDGDAEIVIYRESNIVKSITEDYSIKYYDDDGNLEKILKPNGDIEFYHSWGDIDYVEYPDGTKDVHNPDGSVVSFDAQGAITGIVKNGTSASLVDNVWTLVETGGPTTTYYSDSQAPATYGRPNLLTEADGDVNQYHYNDQNHENGSWTRTLADTTVIEYRPDGTRISQTASNGDVTTFSEEDRIVHIEFNAGGFDDYTYFDDKGTYLVEHSAGGEELKRQEDNSNVRVVDAEGNITIYDADGKPVGKITSDGVTFNFVHNSDGTSTATGTDGTIEEYDSQGELVKVTDPDGIILEYIDDATTDTKKTFVNGLEVTVKKNDTIVYLLEDGTKAVVTLDTNGVPTGVTAEDDQQNSLDAELVTDGKIISIELGDIDETVVRIIRENVYSDEENTVLEHSEGDVLTGVMQGVEPDETFDPASIHTGKGVLTEYVLGEGPGGKTVTYADGKKEYYNQLPVENTSEEETEPSWELYKVEDPNADNSEGEPSTILYLFEGTTVEYDSTGAIMRILNPEGEEVTQQDDGAYVGLSYSGTKYSYRVVVEDGDTVVKPFSVVYSDGRIKIYTKDSSWTVSNTRSESFATYNQKGYITSQRDGEGNFSEYADMGTLMEIVHTDGSIDCYDHESGELQFTLYSQDITAEGINQGDKDIYQADGSVLREDAQGNILSITLPDGVTTASHQADGTYEGTDSETGCIHTYRSDGAPKEVEYPSGDDIDTVEYWRNGTVVYNYANGDERTEQYTGTVVVVQADGTNITYNTDGSASYEITYDSGTHARRISQDADGVIKTYYFEIDGQDWIEKARTEDAGEKEIITYIGSTGQVYRRDQYGRIFKKDTPSSNEVEMTGTITDTVTDSSSNTVVEFEWNTPGYTDGAFKVEMPSGDYYINESGGRLTEYDATAQTTTTTNINGLVKVLNSDATYIITQSDGTTIEFDANDDLTVTIPDGSTITTPDSGSASASLAQDSECEINSADQSIYLEEDSSLTIWYADGKVEIRYGYDPENHATFESNIIYYVDGKVEENNSDGSKTEYFTDGKTICTDADSNTVTYYCSGAVEEVKDGITTTVYIDGAREKIESDGTKFRYEEDSNGRVIITTLTDGTVVTRESDGDITVTNEPSGGSAILDQNANNEYFATLADDVVVTWRTGGNIEIVQPGEEEGEEIMVTQALDGRVILSQTDGTVITQLLDGTLIKRTSDGEETIQTPDGNIITKDTEGKLDIVENISIEVDPDGSVTKWESDGTVITVDTEGNVTTWNTDGSRVTETIHGMTITYNTDESTVYSFDADSTTVTQTPRSGSGIDLTWNVASGSQIAALTENNQVLTVTLTDLTMIFRQQDTFALDDPWEHRGSDKVEFHYSDGRVNEIDDLTAVIGNVRYTWYSSGTVTAESTATGANYFHVGWKSTANIFHDSGDGTWNNAGYIYYNNGSGLNFTVASNGVTDRTVTGIKDGKTVSTYYTYIPTTNGSGTGPASGLVSNIASSSPSIGQNTKLLLTNNKTPLYTYTDFASQGGGSHQVEVGVFHYNITDTIGSYTGQYFVQKSKNYNFVMWSGLNETGTEPLLFANEVHFNRDHEGKLREEIDGMASDSLLYGASEEPMTKTEAQAWCAGLTDNEITQWYEVWIDGKRHLVYECHVVHVLAPPMVKETYKVVYENCSCHEGEEGWGNTDDGEGIREIGVSTALQIPRSADSDSGEYDCHYEFTINGTTYHSDIRPLLQRNFVVNPPKLTNEILTKAEEIDPSAGTGAMNIITASVLGTVVSPVRSGKVVTLKSSAIWGLIKAGMSVKFSSGGRTVSAVISSVNQASNQITLTSAVSLDPGALLMPEISYNSSYSSSSESGLLASTSLFGLAGTLASASTSGYDALAANQVASETSVPTKGIVATDPNFYCKKPINKLRIYYKESALGLAIQWDIIETRLHDALGIDIEFFNGTAPQTGEVNEKACYDSYNVQVDIRNYWLIDELTVAKNSGGNTGNLFSWKYGIDPWDVSTIYINNIVRELTTFINEHPQDLSMTYYHFYLQNFSTNVVLHEIGHALSKIKDDADMTHTGGYENTNVMVADNLNHYAITHYLEYTPIYVANMKARFRIK